MSIIEHETRQIDIDIIQLGISYSQHERMQGIVETIRSLDTGDGAKIEDAIIRLRTRWYRTPKSRRNLSRS